MKPCPLQLPVFRNNTENHGRASFRFLNPCNTTHKETLGFLFYTASSGDKDNMQTNIASHTEAGT